MSVYRGSPGLRRILGTIFDVVTCLWMSEWALVRSSQSVIVHRNASAEHPHRPLSRRLDHCDRVIQNESRYPFGGNVYYVTMQITLITRKFWNVERNYLHYDVVHITTKWVSSLTLDCNGIFAIKAYGVIQLHRDATGVCVC